MARRASRIAAAGLCESGRLPTTREVQKLGRSIVLAATHGRLCDPRAWGRRRQGGLACGRSSEVHAWQGVVAVCVARLGERQRSGRGFVRTPGLCLLTAPWSAFPLAKTRQIASRSQRRSQKRRYAGGGPQRRLSHAEKVLVSDCADGTAATACMEKQRGPGYGDRLLRGRSYQPALCGRDIGHGRS